MTSDGRELAGRTSPHLQRRVEAVLASVRMEPRGGDPVAERSLGAQEL